MFSRRGDLDPAKRASGAPGRCPEEEEEGASRFDGDILHGSVNTGRYASFDFC